MARSSACVTLLLALIVPAQERAAAHHDDPIREARGAEFWSFRPPRDQRVPQPADRTWPRGPIDRFLLARMEAAGVRRPVIAVHDLSGHIALEVVRRMKEPPRGLVFVGASVPDLFHTAMEMLPFLTRAAIAVMRLRRHTPPASVRLHYALAHPLMCNDMRFSECATRVVGRLLPIPLRLFNALPNPDTLEPTCPITYAVLNRDRYLPPRVQREMAASFPQARVVELDYGHEAPVTHPQEVADLILAYA